MKRLVFFAAMLAIAASCGVNEIDNGSETTHISTPGTGNSVNAPDITAAFDEKVTKSTITTDKDGVGTIWWTPADEINVFYDKTSTHYISQNIEKATSATFSTTDVISIEALASKNVWGLYPYDAAAECDGSSVTTTIPASQKAVEGTFDDDLFTSLAHSDGTEMKFFNVLGGIKFSLSRDDIRSITFRGNNNEDIAGKVSLFMDKDGTPAASVVEDEGVKTITLTPKEGTCFASDTFYYLVMLPVELSEGFTMTMDTKTGVLVLDSRSSVQIKRSIFKRAAEIDKRATAMSPFTISGDGFTVSLKKTGSPEEISLEYRFGGGDWKPYVIGTELPADSDKPMSYQDMTLQFRAGEGGNKNFSKDKENYYYFESRSKVKVSGNIMSLLDGTMQDNTLYDFAFYQLFENNYVVDASGLKLPATVLAPNCYESMFAFCSFLTSVPELPATTLAAGCYKSMFLNCVNLESSPELPATTLAKSCYEDMFLNCGKMSQAPELPATTLEESCYFAMFNGCDALSAAPKLPATALAKNCYMLMFSGCSGLTSAPELPLTTLADGCYNGMFSYCDYLESAPTLPATALTYACYKDMFSNCVRLAEAPVLPAITMAKSCYSGMFNSCTGLTTAPELPATTLAESCYSSMFKGCTGLASAPELPATTLAESCYSNMFSDCSKLNEAPYLPAKTLADYCYASMFYGCTSLKVISVEFTSWKANEKNTYPETDNWLKKASTTGVFYCPPALDTKSNRDVSHVPSGWEVRCNPLESITLDPAEFNILVGETSAAPTVIFEPEYFNNKIVSWSSSNESVAKVDAAGRVTGVSEGNATITAVSEEGGKTSTSTVTVTGVGPADLPGTFSVSADSKVSFSRGNLYWNGAKWRFESNQYDFPHTWNPEHVGHLAWVKDEAKAVSGTWSDDWKSDCTSLFTNDPAEPQSPNPDFRIYETKGKYRTLTSDEWNYLLNVRTFNENKSGEGHSYEFIFDKAIGGIKVFGLFIFPDGFKDQNSWKTKYTTWNTINEAGIVFLPAAGYREGSEMWINPVIESSGYYWTPDLDHKSTKYNYAKDLIFDVHPESTGDRQLRFDKAAASDAYSIRLVTESEPAIGALYIFDGIVGMYVGNTSDGKKLIVATKNYGSASTTGKGTSYTRAELNSLSIPAGWQLPTAADMEVLAKLGFKTDSTNDGAYSSRYDFFIPYTQSVSGSLREGRIWVVGGSDNDFYWFRSDDKYGLTTTETVKPDYYVRLVKKL